MMSEASASWGCWPGDTFLGRDNSMRRGFCLAVMAAAMVHAGARGADEPAAIPLWPHGAPGAKADGGALKVRVAERGERVLSNVHAPTLTPYLPSAEKATGCAVIVAP